MRVSHLFKPPYLVLIGLTIACALMLLGAAPTHDLLAPGLMMAGVAAVPINPELTAVAVGYKNNDVDLIADRVMPRVDTAYTFKWTEYPSEQAYTVPETRVGRKSEPDVVTFEGDEHESSVEDFGLQDPVPNRDIEIFDAMPKPAGGGPLPPLTLSTMMLTNLLMLAREIRVAATVFDSDNFDSGLQETLSGTDQWSDYENSDPIRDLMLALDQPLIRPDTLTISQETWTTLRMHPKAVRAVYRDSSAGDGTITRQQLVDVLEIRQLLVGAGRVNTARRGQAASMSRVWGKHAALTYSNPQAAELFQPVWGWTAQFGGKIARTVSEEKKGLKGSTTVIVGEQVRELVPAKAAGYLFQNVIA